MTENKRNSLLLATDLDGTFLAGDDEEKNKLYRLISESHHMDLVFVTGRGLQTVTPLFVLPEIPRPSYIICDVGATLVQGETLEPVKEVVSEIENLWPGPAKIYEVFSKIKGLTYQDVPMERRSSYFYNSDTNFEEVHYKAGQLGVDLIISHGKYIDILPKGVNKGTTLQKLVNLLNVDTDNILVAGDTLNDLSLFKTGYKGVAVGGSEPGLLEATAKLENVYHAQKTGTGGILEAMGFYQLGIELK